MKNEPTMLLIKRLFVCLVSIAAVQARIIDLEKDGGAIPDDSSLDVAWRNGGIFNSTFANMLPGDTLVVPNKTFHIMGGIQASGLNSVTISIDGTLIYSDDIKSWPRNSNNGVNECMYFKNLKNVTFTSSGKGLVDGSGRKWWGLPLIGYLVRQEDRPRLLNIEASTDILIENIILKDSPYWTFWVHGVNGLEVRNVDIHAARSDWESHSLYDLTAFNTDGFDVSGRNVWIHDCTVWNQDDSVCVKDDSQNMLFERITASGLGLTVGSIGSSVVRNITFRDIYMPNTYKGIYMKFRGDGGSVSDVTYENIVMDAPEQYAVWIGPAQQSDSIELCAAHPCSICWPTVPFSKCNAPESLYSNIVVRNVTINNPKSYVGVILGSETMPMQGVTFEDVVVNNPAKGKEMYYACEGVQGGVAKGATNIVPSCFEKQ